ncbi:twin-arginine translocation pathway signal protein [Roseococcus sp. SDR]|uniref:Bug family tripartite tricarboxylate transporter substrate binding protein n=1 Tax=Roseococcus sp. SDR TaxID=2835532 RepID=UPI001BCEEA71|nr:tripartite tricarboxylate transporter substrate-binding protein [Roseococcus sp. SDR]MBS7792537.1 twin-arginine translocation pathway signal protein [Roseococcus sp. SDR]MBV1847851.1 twin-arginine translocation pathway signal protein [Roseococcus sp. SDR]
MIRITRRATLGAILAAPAIASAQSWPAGSIRIVVPFAPGGSTDAVARLAAPGLSQRLGVPVVVENRSGAAGSLGTQVVATARPDGQTWLLTFDSHATLPALLPNLPFNLTRDLDPVMLIGGAPYVIATRPDKPYRTLADVVAAARARPDAISYGSTGNGTIGHLTMILLGSRANIRMAHVPYRGGGLAVNDTVAGHVEMMIGSAAVVAPHIAGGTLRPVVQFGPERLPALAQVPTAVEGGFQGLEAEAWWGVFAPHGTPDAIQARMFAALKESFQEERVTRTMTETQQARVVLGDKTVLGPFLDRQIAQWGGLVREFRIQAD